MRTELVGIVNVTPDSFSDGGDAFLPEEAIARVAQCFLEGAAVVDIGAQSTRPGAEFISAPQEWQRLEEVLPEAVRLARGCGGTVSVDTFHPEVAQKALALGVDWINDVTGLENPAMVEVVRASACRLVLMHSLGVPPQRDFTLDAGQDPLHVLNDYFLRRIEALQAAGIEKSRLLLDPGIGFGTTPAQALAVLVRAGELHIHGVDLLVGHSRKSFLGLFTQAPSTQRDDLTLAFSAMLASGGVRYLRVHNVLRHATLLAAMDANLPHRKR